LVSVFDTASPSLEEQRDAGCRFAQVDVSDEVSVASALDDAERAHGVARILVNCAGVAPSGRTVNREFQPHSLALFKHTLNVNLIGSFNVLSQFAARLARAEPVNEERGAVILTASIAAFEGQVGQAAYAASKAGVVGMTLPIARDLAQYGIRVMTIAPGIFMTPMFAGLPEPTQELLQGQVPHPSRAGRPSEFAQLVGSIIVNPMLNGETIRIDGAFRMGPR
jgi:NAD(P)-dependent dehydrogenase (short-subunit alcohol dehydrogenase family)